MLGGITRRRSAHCGFADNNNNNNNIVIFVPAPSGLIQPVRPPPNTFILLGNAPTTPPGRRLLSACVPLNQAREPLLTPPSVDLETLPPSSTFTLLGTNPHIPNPSCSAHDSLQPSAAVSLHPADPGT